MPVWQQQLVGPAEQVQVCVVPAAWAQQEQEPLQQPQQLHFPGQDLQEQEGMLKAGVWSGATVRFVRTRDEMTIWCLLQPGVK